MPLYRYTALSPNGSLLSGESVAASEEALNQSLTGQGLLLQSARKQRSGLSLRRPRLKPVDFLFFNQELIALVRAGLTIPEALKLAADRPDNPLLGGTLGRVLEAVRGGALFSDACVPYPEVFDGLYIAALKTGEKTGALAAVLEKYQGHLKQRVALQKKINQALAYPKFLLLVLALILGILFLFVMPRFVAMYAGMGAELPLPTRVLMGFVDHLPIYLPLLLGVAALGWWLGRLWLATPRGRLQLDEAWQRLPLLGSIIRDVAVAQLARTLATLLSGGTPLVEAMRTCQASLTNQASIKRLAEALAGVTGGQSLTEAMRNTGLMPNTALKMIEVGEASGGLDRMLAEIAQFYEEKLDSQLERVMALIEPLLMLLMGVLIGGVIIVMYLPIFHMADIIK